MFLTRITLIIPFVLEWLRIVRNYYSEIITCHYCSQFFLIILINIAYCLIWPFAVLPASSWPIDQFTRPDSELRLLHLAAAASLSVCSNDLPPPLCDLPPPTRPKINCWYKSREKLGSR